MEMEARGVRTQVGDESRRIDAANRNLERQAAQREKQQVDIEAAQAEPQMCVLPELVFSSESERERSNSTSVRSNSDRPPQLSSPLSRYQSPPLI